MSRLSQTMRIDIPPDLKEDLWSLDTLRQRLSSPEDPLLPVLESADPSASSLGDSDFQQLLQSVYDGALIATMDGRIQDANARVLYLLQHRRDDLLKLSLTDVISGSSERTIATLQAGLEKDRYILIQAYCLRSNNKLFPCEIAINRLDVRGVQYFCCFIRDTTWRRQAEEMLRTVHNAIENSRTGIAVADLEGQIDYINEAGARLWGQNMLTSLIGLKLHDLIAEQEAVEAMIAAIHRGESLTSEIVLVGERDVTTHIQMSVAPNRDADDHLIGMVISFQDISDRIRANVAEQQADRQRVVVESLGAACHHLGQPATVLLASLELLARVRDADRGLADELLASSIEAAESLRKMLHGLNDITEYKTTAYIEPAPDSGAPEPRILDLSTVTHPS